MPLIQPFPRMGQHALPMGCLIPNGVQPWLAVGCLNWGWSNAQSSDETAPLLIPVPNGDLQYSLLRRFFQNHLLKRHLFLPDRVAVVLNNAHLPLPRGRFVGEEVDFDNRVRFGAGPCPRQLLALFHQNSESASRLSLLGVRGRELEG